MVVDMGANPKFLILATLNNTIDSSWYSPGGANYLKIKALDLYLKNKYPNNFLMIGSQDLREYLVSQYNPSIPQDVTNHNNDTIPSSLMADTVHLNDAGYQLVANRIADFLTAHKPSLATKKLLSYSDLQTASAYALPLNSMNLANRGILTINGTVGMAGDNVLNNYFFAGATPNFLATGNQNIGIGFRTLNMNTIGSDNLILGYESGMNNTTGSQNVTLGNMSLFANVTGSDNVAIGAGALYGNTGDGNTSVGSQSGVGSGSSYNTLLGYGAGFALSSITNSMALGNEATITASNQIVFGNSSITQNIFHGSLGGISNYIPNSYITRNYFNSTAYLDGAIAGAINATGNFNVTGNVGIGTSGQSVPLAVSPGSYGSNLVINGDFSSPAAGTWTGNLLAAPWGLVYGVAIFVNSGTGNLTQNTSTVQAGHIYKLTFDVMETSGTFSVTPSAGGWTGTTRNTTGTFTEYFTASNATALSFHGSASAADPGYGDNIDNVTLADGMGVAASFLGTVGIGTANPGNNTLKIVGSLCVNATDASCAGSAAGKIYATTTSVQSADYAEYFKTKNSDLKPGEVVCVDTNKDNAVQRCQNDGDNNVMGVVSTNPGIVGNNNDDVKNNPKNYAVIAMLGQIPGLVETTSDNAGSIQIGDALTASSTPGYMRKAQAGESTVGVALQNFPSTSLGTGNQDKGTIQVLISRKNKSLTVDAVETQVTDRIAQLNIQDQVNTIVANSQKTLEDSLNLRLTTLEQKQSDLSTLLDAQIKQLQDLTLSSAKLDLNSTEIDNIKTALGIDYAKDKDGKITGVNIGTTNLINKLTAQMTETGQLIISVKDKDAKTIGSDTIKAGDTSVEIKTTTVDENSNIFTTINSKISNPPVLMIPEEEMTKGKGFKVEIPEALKEDVNFKWWIVETDSAKNVSP